MGVFGIILLVLFVIVCILLVLLVVVQGENSQGLGGIFGGASDTTFGSQSSNIMTKITYIAGASFLILAFGLGFLSRTPDTPNLLDSVQNDTVVEQTKNWWNDTETESE
ncbi:MAG: preprotein translocase subunit SecG [Bacteroidetes bacterium]|nr:preprotein translocase subunit SecG [Bacteroidota bacterium]